MIWVELEETEMLAFSNQAKASRCINDDDDNFYVKEEKGSSSDAWGSIW